MKAREKDAFIKGNYSRGFYRLDNDENDVHERMLTLVCQVGGLKVFDSDFQVNAVQAE